MNNKTIEEAKDWMRRCILLDDEDPDSIDDLAELLGCKRDRVHDWIVRGLLKTRRRNYPEWLKDIPIDRLKIILSQRTVDQITSRPDRTRGVRFKVRSDRTGQVYESLRSAEKDEFLSRACISEIVKTGRTTREGFGFSLIQRG